MLLSDIPEHPARLYLSGNTVLSHTVSLRLHPGSFGLQLQTAD